MRTPTKQERYERYSAWCQIQKVPVAPVEIWEKEMRRISEMQILDKV